MVEVIFGMDEGIYRGLLLLARLGSDVSCGAVFAVFLKAVVAFFKIFPSVRF